MRSRVKFHSERCCGISIREIKRKGIINSSLNLCTLVTDIFSPYGICRILWCSTIADCRSLIGCDLFCRIHNLVEEIPTKVITVKRIFISGIIGLNHNTCTGNIYSQLPGSYLCIYIVLKCLSKFIKCIFFFIKLHRNRMRITIFFVHKIQFIIPFVNLNWFCDGLTVNLGIYGRVMSGLFCYFFFLNGNLRFL